MAQLPKVPTARRQPAGFTLNKQAVGLLTQEQESYAAVLVGKDGGISLHPIATPRGTTAIVKVVSPTKSASRVAIPERRACCYRAGARYACRWDDVQGKLDLTFQEV